MKKIRTILLTLSSLLVLASCDQNSASDNPSSETPTSDNSSKLYSINYDSSTSGLKDFVISFLDGATSISEAKQGTVITIRAISFNGNKWISRVYSNDVEISTIVKGERFSFTMPNKDVNLTFEVGEKDKVNVNVNADSGVEAILSYDGEVGTSFPVGSKINVELSFKQGYYFNSFDIGSLPFEVIEKNRLFSFTLPENSPTINVSSVYNPKSYKVSSISYLGFKDALTLKGLEEGDTHNEGENISFSITHQETEEYEVVAYLNNEPIKGNYENGAYTFSFTMPSLDSSIVISRAAKSSENGNLVVRIDDRSEGYHVYGIKSETHYDVKNGLDIPFGVVLEKGYRLKTLTIQLDNNDPKNLLNQNLNSLEFFASPTNKVALITIEAIETGAYDIHFTNESSLLIKGNTNGVTAGEKVSLTVLGKGNKVVTGIENYSCLDTSFSPAYIEKTSTLSFTMPSSNVTFTMKVSDGVSLTYESCEGLKNVTFRKGPYTSSEEVSLAKPSDTIYAFIEVENGYELKEASLAGSKSSLTIFGSSNKYVTINCPDSGSVSLVLIVLKQYNVTYEASNAYSLKFTDGESVHCKDDTVKFVVTANAGYDIKSVSLDDNEIEVTLTSGTYSFKMPGKDVKIMIETEKVEMHTIKKASTLTGIDGVSIRLYSTGATASSSKKYNAGTTFKITFSLKIGFTLNDVLINNVPNKAERISETNGTYEYKYVLDNEDVIVSFDVTEAEKASIHYDTEKLLVNNARYVEKTDTLNENSDETYSAYVNQKVRFEFAPKDKDSYYFDQVNASSLEILDGSGNKIEASRLDITSKERLVIEFTLPESGISNITFSLSPYTKYSYKKGENADLFDLRSKYSDGVIYAEDATFKEGSSVTVYINPSAYETVTSYRITITNDSDGKILKEEKRATKMYNYTTFAVGKSNFTVNVTAES